MKLKSKQGFTLIELLVVVAIIGLLSSVVLASLSTARMKARDTKRMQDLKQIQTALELYRNDHNGEYPKIDVSNSAPQQYACSLSSNTNWNNMLTTALVPKYISALPKDPINNNSCPTVTDGYSYFYRTGLQGCANFDCYDLLARFEDPNNPYRCEIKKYTDHVNGSWCTASFRYAIYSASTN